MWSCINGSWEVAERLLTVPEVDLNHRDKLGMTAFMWSCFYGRKEIVELLLKNPMSDQAWSKISKGGDDGAI